MWNNIKNLLPKQKTLKLPPIDASKIVPLKANIPQAMASGGLTPKVKMATKISPIPTSAPKQSVESLVAKTFPEDPGTALAVFKHESQLGKYFQNIGGAPAYGVAQIYLPAHRDKIPGATDAEKINWLRDPANNLKVARQIYDNAGHSFNPWESYTTGRYKKFLNGN